MMVSCVQCHGDVDPTVPCLWGQMTAQILGQFLTKHEFKVYKVFNIIFMFFNFDNFYLYFQGLMHSSNDDELREVKQFIEKRLK